MLQPLSRCRNVLPGQWLAWIIALCQLVTAAVAAENSWVHQHYGLADGLPVSSASSGQIDSDGFLWVSTHDGLARFDGQRFKVYDSMRYPAMSGNRIRHIYRNPQGRLFAHSEQGDWLGIRAGSVESAAPTGASASPVLHVDSRGLCLTTVHALYCPDNQGELLVRATFPPAVTAQLALPGVGDSVWLVSDTQEVWLQQAGQWRRIGSLPRASALNPAVLVAADGSLWVAPGGQLYHGTLAGEIVRNDALHSVTYMHKDAQGWVWVGTVDAMHRIAPDGSVQRIAVGGDRASFRMVKGWLGGDGSVWISVDQDLWRFEDAAAVRSIAEGDDRPEPVLRTSGIVLDVLFTEDGTVWVMTLRDGIHRLNRARVTLLDDKQGSGGSNVYGVSRDNQGTMWLGTLGDGLKAIDHQGRVRGYGVADGLPGENPWLVSAAPDGTIYVGTVAPGLWRRNSDSDRFERVQLPEALSQEQILTILFGARGEMWLGSGAGAWKMEAGAWSRQWPTTDERIRVNALALSEQREVWFGGAAGVWRRHDGKLHPVAPALLERALVRDLYRDREGALWISTDGRGLVRVAPDDPTGQQAVRLGRSEGLPSNSPHAVREDRSGQLWVNSNQGIFRIGSANLGEFLAGNAHRLSPLVLGLADGLTELEGNGGVQPAAAFDTYGRLWFPSQRGVVRFDPMDIPMREQPPRAVIDGLESDGRVLGLSGERVVLPSGVRSLLIRYGAADLHAGSQVRFRYRLLPQDQGWTEADTDRSAGFARLAPGKHRFELLAGNSDGTWARLPTALDIEVPYYWYETTLFRLAVLLALGVLILFVMRLRVHHLRQQAWNLDRQVRTRTTELEEEKHRVESTLADLSHAHQALAQTHDAIESRNQQLAEQARRLESMDRFRTRVLADVSHELRTPVMLVSLPLRELHANARALTQTDRRRLNLSLQQLDRLAALVEQLVGLVQAESGQIRLRVSRIDLIALLRQIVAGYQPAAERVDVVLRLQSKHSALLVYADRQQLFTVFGNLVDNAIKFAPAGSEVLLKVQQDSELVRVDVQDQGPGFDPALAAQLFERFYRVEGPPRHGREGLGIGLALARELVELHGGRIGASSAPGSGARFRVELPLGCDHVALDDLALDEERSVGAPLPAAVAETGTGRILLVEDHPDLAAYLAERLGDHFSVTCVDSAERALEVLSEDAQIQLVVSDVVLPHLSGLELCRRLSSAAEGRVLPVILISAKAGDADRAAGLAAGARAYLAKPFGFESLLNAVAEALPASASLLSSRPADASVSDPLLKVALEALADAAFTVAQWAERSHLSERQLRRRVAELTQQAPQTWLREQRLLRVHQLVRSGACRTLAEAGLRCGLDNPAYLYRRYRARFGEQ